VRYHHILDPRTGYPARLCRSVTVLARDATTSDALTKGVFILGPRRGLELIGRLDGVEAIVIDDQGKMYLSPGLAGLGLNAETVKRGKEPL
jgi:thiamine biosynthesis lipoprotein